MEHQVDQVVDADPMRVRADKSYGGYTYASCMYRLIEGQEIMPWKEVDPGDLATCCDLLGFFLQEGRLHEEALPTTAEEGGSILQRYMSHTGCRQKHPEGTLEDPGNLPSELDSDGNLEPAHLDWKITSAKVLPQPTDTQYTEQCTKASEYTPNGKLGDMGTSRFTVTNCDHILDEGDNLIAKILVSSFPLEHKEEGTSPSQSYYTQNEQSKHIVGENNSTIEAKHANQAKGDDVLFEKNFVVNLQDKLATKTIGTDALNGIASKEESLVRKKKPD